MSSQNSVNAKRLRIRELQDAVAAGQHLTMLTAYDSLIAPLLENAGVDMLLIGDSVGNVNLGYQSTIPVSLDDIQRATEAVVRSTARPFIVADLPFGSYEKDCAQAFESSARLLKAGAGAVKLEGGSHRAETVSFLTQNGVPVMGHLGYTPQSENTLSGPRLQGKGDAGQALLDDARKLEEAGAFSLVLEMVPAELAAQITESISIPTIGIGAGAGCNGQVLVWADMAGMTSWTPRFVRRFAEAGKLIEGAASEYVKAVQDGSFPAQSHSRNN